MKSKEKEQVLLQSSIDVEAILGEPKKETLEEAAKKFAKQVYEREMFKGLDIHRRINLKQGCQLGYMQGFKDCEEQNKGLYSEEEVKPLIKMLQKCKEYFLLKTDNKSEERADAIGQLLEQFKKQ